MVTGTVKSVRDEGYGFITPKGAANAGAPVKDIFYHNSGLTGELVMRKLKVGDEVEFDVEQNDRGPKAVNIRLAGVKEASEEVAQKAAEETMSTEESEETQEPETEAVA